MTVLPADSESVPSGMPRAVPSRAASAVLPRSTPVRRSAAASGDPDEDDEDLGDEEDLSVAQPAADEDSAFDDFDDDFDDDFEEEEDDPDWDHPDEGDGDTPPAGKGPGRKK